MAYVPEQSNKATVAVALVVGTALGLEQAFVLHHAILLCIFVGVISVPMFIVLRMLIIKLIELI